jgi:hypothetical protein
VQPAQAGQQAATVRRIAVTGNDHDLDIKITASKPVTPHTEFVTDPDRLVVDIPEARPGGGLQTIPIHRGKLRDVRVGLLSANPPITRIVLDLAAAPEFRVLPLVNTVLVKLGTRAVPEGVSEPAAIVALNDPPPAARPVAVTTPAVAIAPLEQPSQLGWAHWTIPILFSTIVAAMLITALVAHIQNRRYPRGL